MELLTIPYHRGSGVERYGDAPGFIGSFPHSHDTPNADGQLTPLRNPLDRISWSDCPVEKPPDTGLRDAAAPEFTLEATFPTPMQWLAEAQARPLKVVIGANP